MGEHYTLTCTARVPDGEQITSLQWKDSIDHALQMSTGPSAALALQFQPLRIADGGKYTCTATYDNGDSRHISEVVFVKGKPLMVCIHRCMDTLCLPLLVPPPTVSAMKVNAPNIVYAGLNLTLQCDVALVNVTNTHVAVVIEWKKNGWSSSLMCPENQRLSQTEFRCTAAFTPLNFKNDNGTYTCMATLTPRSQYKYLKTQTGVSSGIPLQVAGDH